MDAWYVMVWGQEHGPVTLNGLKELADTGRLRRTDRIRQGAGNWVNASTNTGLFPVEIDCSEADTADLPIAPNPGN